jgi:hypothetical protein
MACIMRAIGVRAVLVAWSVRAVVRAQVRLHPAEQQGQPVVLFGGQGRRRVNDSADLLLEPRHPPEFGEGAARHCNL